MCNSTVSDSSDHEFYRGRKRRKYSAVPPWPQSDRIDDEPAQSAMPLPPGTPQYYRGDPHPTKVGYRFIRWQNGTAVWGDASRWWETKRKAMIYRRKKSTLGIHFVARILHNAAQQRAKRSGVPFTLSREDIVRLIQESGDYCPALGFKFHGQGRYEKGCSPGSRSLHRIRPEYGYQMGNVVVVSMRANRLIALYKSGDELRKLANFVDATNTKMAELIGFGELLPPAF